LRVAIVLPLNSAGRFEQSTSAAQFSSVGLFGAFRYADTVAVPATQRHHEATAFLDASHAI
jgi:hypothetical protein